MISRSQSCNTTFVVIIMLCCTLLSKTFPNISKQVAKEKEEAGKMLEERKSRKVGQPFSMLANEASTELHNANYSMQPNLSKIDFSIEKLRQLFVSTSSHCLVFPCQLITLYQLIGVYFPIIR